MKKEDSNLNTQKHIINTQVCVHIEESQIVQASPSYICLLPERYQHERNSQYSSWAMWESDGFGFLGDFM